jgi:hypothetical protein
MTTEQDLLDELARARDLRREYTITVRALAVAVERLLQATGGDSLEISDEAINAAPDLRAWRNSDRRTVEIQVTRTGSATG